MNEGEFRRDQRINVVPFRGQMPTPRFYVTLYLDESVSVGEIAHLIARGSTTIGISRDPVTRNYVIRRLAPPPKGAA